MLLEIQVSETTAAKLQSAIALDISRPVLFTGSVGEQEHKFLLCHGTEEGLISHDGYGYTADVWINELFRRNPNLATVLEEAGGELFLICCHQDKQLPERDIPGGKLIVPFPDWEGENQIFLAQTCADEWILSFGNKKLWLARKR